MKKIALVLILLFFQQFIHADIAVAQTSPLGAKITYKITYLDEGIDPKEVKSLPSTLELLIKGVNSRADYGKDFIIFLGKKHLMYYGSTSNGKKKYKEVLMQDDNTNTIREIRDAKSTGEKKIIAGSNCIKFIVVNYYKEIDATLEDEVWSLPNTPVSFIPELSFDGIKGCPFSFQTTLGKHKVSLEAVKYEKIPVADSKFVLPAGAAKEEIPVKDSILIPANIKVMEVK